MLKLNVPFYGNTSDDLHCYQASLRMVLKYFLPDKDYDFVELDKATEKEERFSTWPQAGMIWMRQQGLDVSDIEVFDYKKFIASPNNYLKEIYGKEGGKWQIKYSNIPKEQKTCREFIKEVKIQLQIPSVADIKKLLKQSYIPVCLVNSCSLNNKSGYVDHIIVVIGYDNKGIFLHDPGLPPLKARFVDYSLFEKAWAYPDDKAKCIMAFGRKE